MDQDKSGKVVYRELRDMVRSDISGLGLKAAQLPEARLKSLWRALDDDDSGYITAKEFGLFMKKGEAATSGPGPARRWPTTTPRSRCPTTGARR